MRQYVPALRAFATRLIPFPGLTAGAIPCRPSGPVLLGVLAMALALARTTTSAEPEIRIVERDKSPIAFEAAGLPAKHLAALTKLPADDEAWARTLSVYVGKTIEAGKPAIGGTYEVRGDVLRFTPSFPLKGGLSYRVEVFLPAPNRESAPSRHEKVFTLPAAPQPAPAKVTAVYPSAKVLPDNQLRFYLHFSAPMRLGEVYDHVRLLKEDGTPVNAPFLEIGEELWDTSRTRLTLLLDPGRVKRGLTPREMFGPVLETGGKYTLVVETGWKDASGQPLAAEFRKEFKAGPPNETALDHKAWKITPPAAGTRGPLTIAFTHPLDRALLERTITIASPAGTEIAGEVTVGKDERSWEFRPHQPWKGGKYELVVDTVLEDTAGNRIGRPFEVDRFDQIDKGVVAEFVRLPLEIRPGK